MIDIYQLVLKDVFAQPPEAVCRTIITYCPETERLTQIIRDLLSYVEAPPDGWAPLSDAAARVVKGLR